MWNSIFDILPLNNQIVWIRVLNIYGPPVLAQWKTAQQSFTTIDTSITIPSYFCARWKSQ